MARFSDIWTRVLTTVLFLAVYRLGVFVSCPGINVAKLRESFENGGGQLFGLVNMFSGGAFENFSIFTLGIAPYISVSIIIQLLTPSVPFLAELKKDGERGRRQLTRYTRIGTLVLALLQGYVIAMGLEAKGLVVEPGLSFRIIAAFTLASGTAFIMWLGEQITERGIGNGVSILIFAGIVARMPSVLVSTLVLSRTGLVSAFAILAVLCLAVATIVCVVFVEKSQRRIPIQYPRRTVGSQVVQAPTQYMPLKVNMAGVIPPIFASALLIIPSYFLGLSESEYLISVLSFLEPGALLYEFVFALLILVFSFFYTSILFNPVEVSENLKKNGGFIPGFRPGVATSDYLFSVLEKLTLWGALYIAAICIIPQAIYISLGVSEFSYVFGGTAILIVVGVTLDTASQIESITLSRNYDAMMKFGLSSAQGKRGVGSRSYNRSRLLKR